MTRIRFPFLPILVFSSHTFADASGSFGLPPLSSAVAAGCDRENLRRRRQRQPQPQPRRRRHDAGGRLPSILGVGVRRSSKRPHSPLALRGGSQAEGGDAGEIIDGGDVGTAARRKKSKKGSKKKRQNPSSASASASNKNDDATEADAGTRKAINDAMKKSDAATALGNAIRDRADFLRRDVLPSPESTFDAALASLGLSMGTSGVTPGTGDDAVAAARRDADADDASAARWDSEGGGVRPSPSALVANYFLQTHGGAHALQCALSVLASLFGLGCLLVPPPTTLRNSDATGGARLDATKLILLRRSLQCALAKHSSGLVGAALLGAANVPEMGLRRTRRYVAALALDPVSQYLFYCALLLVWTSLESGGGIFGVVVAEVPWWLQRGTGGSIIPVLLIGPVLLREVASALWAVSDVAVLLSSGCLPFPLRAARAVLDAVVCVLVRAPEAWRTASSAARQRTLAGMLSRTSLGMELAVGVVLALDALRSFLAFSLASTPAASASPESAPFRPALRNVAGKIACTHLYINFLLARRKKIVALVGSVRGGAIVNRVLDVLIDPGKVMGLEGRGDDDGDDWDGDDGLVLGDKAKGGKNRSITDRCEMRRNLRTAASALGIVE